MFRKIRLEVLIIKNFIVLQKVLQNSQHFIFIKSLFSGLNKFFLFLIFLTFLTISYNSISSSSSSWVSCVLFKKFKAFPITSAEFCFDSISYMSIYISSSVVTRMT